MWAPYASVNKSIAKVKCQLKILVYLAFEEGDKTLFENIDVNWSA